MKKIYLLFAVACLLSACVKPSPEQKSEEEKIVDAFNSKGYDFALSFADGQYEMIPAKKIAANSIKTLIDGRSWQPRLVGEITLSGYSEKQFDGEAYTIITFSGEKAGIVSTPEDPSMAVMEWEESVTYGDNLLCLGETHGIVCAISDTKVYYLKRAGGSKTNNRWLYSCLEANDEY